MKVVLVPVEEYQRLLERAIHAPKMPPPLTAKQKSKIHDAMMDASMVEIKRRLATLQPQAVQELAAQSLNHH